MGGEEKRSFREGSRFWEERASKNKPALVISESLMGEAPQPNSSKRKKKDHGDRALEEEPTGKAPIRGRTKEKMGYIPHNGADLNLYRAVVVIERRGKQNQKKQKKMMTDLEERQIYTKFENH